ncbi:transcriptional regulator [Microbacterium testaceum StLB037]|uniref:Transcriptional regulator n=1 Tax=Microbacterium testaceum (strain StLB037) TaxID=979556 RepID=E8NFR2_MICTS|nr:transcriptional regulator [Microbacterium testaceum StLB037]
MRVTSPENSMTRCLRWRSTIDPKTIANTASSSMYAPPTMPVARTERVSRYTQKVSANHRKLVVTLAAAVFTRTARNVRFPPTGAPAAVAAEVGSGDIATR